MEIVNIKEKNMKDIKITMIKTEDIIPYEKNPRNNDNAVESVANSIKEFGFKTPIVVDKNLTVINGHTRLKASKLLGLKEVPCIIADDLTAKQVKALRIADNKVGELATWNNDLLGEELKGLTNFSFEDLGFNEIELMMLTEDIEPAEFDKDLMDEYSQRADDMVLKAGRVIITYEKPEEKAFLEELFKEKKDCLKVIYKCEDIIKNMEE